MNSATSTTLSIRLDSALKKQSQQILNRLGMDISSATKIFLTQIVQRKAIPFEIRTQNGFTHSFEKSLIKDKSDFEKNRNKSKKYKDIKTLVADLGL